MSYIGSQPTTTAFVTDTFNGNGSTTVFTMSLAPATTSSILVAVTGVLQDPSTYSVSGTTLTFSAAPPSGTGNISVRYLGIPASGVTTTAYRTVTDFTATAGQTTFSPPSYTVGYIDVYRNGSKLGTADFTATNGTTVVLAAACNAGDLVQTVSFYVSSVLNAIPATAGAVNSTYIAAGAVGSTQIAAGGVAYNNLLSTDWTNSKASSGYQKLPSGLIIQWGANGFGSGTVSVTFPIAFPTSCLWVNASVGRGSTLSGYLMSLQVGSWNTTGVSITGNYTTGGGAGISALSNNETANWIAIGY